MKPLLSAVLVFMLALPFPAKASEPEAPSIAWQGWTENLFEKAKAENKFVLLDLEAVWCHWCHVMKETTYQDSRVTGLLAEKYLAVRVDQDSRPDLANRYGDWGWPATIVFGPGGEEIVKRRGYIPPDAMASLLQAIIDDPTPGPSVVAEEPLTPSEAPLLGASERGLLLENHAKSYDAEFGGWGTRHKLVDFDRLEYALANAGSEEEKKRALFTLDQALLLLDPAWGGFYQYSDQQDWKSPHFEKIMPIQSGAMRLYALAYQMTGKEEYLNAARRTADFVQNFLTSPDGAFYASQDADLKPGMDSHPYFALPDAARRKLGVPRVDTHRYSRENGWMITALTALYDATGEEEYLLRASKAADWITTQRALEGGGFRHDEQDATGPYLADTLAMARALLSLYVSSAERKWLASARESAAFIEKNFRDAEAGYFSAARPAAETGALAGRQRLPEENAEAARVMNLLFHHTGAKEYRESADHAMRFLASPALIKNKPYLVGILTAARELSQDPVHIAVVGPKAESPAKQLFQAALRYPSSYKRVEWWDKREGPMPNPDVQYTELPKPAAFACAARTCSLPVFDPGKLAAQVDRLQRASDR